jgi:NTP pyrophosphatase (non-canonical NTP hydrolase)
MDTTLRELTDPLLAFREERDWKQFHNPKDQILSLVLEASELLEHTQWKNGDDLLRHLETQRESVEDELADVLGWVLLIAHDLNVDLAAAMRRKLAKNVAKYPADQARGSAAKYHAYQQRPDS